MATATRKKKTVKKVESPWVSIRYIVDRTGLPYSSIYGQLGREDFPPHMLRPKGKQYRFLKTEVDEWIEAHELSRLPEKHLTREQRLLVLKYFSHRSLK